LFPSVQIYFAAFCEFDRDNRPSFNRTVLLRVVRVLICVADLIQEILLQPIKDFLLLGNDFECVGINGPEDKWQRRLR